VTHEVGERRVTGQAVGDHGGDRQVEADAATSVTQPRRRSGEVSLADHETLAELETLLLQLKLRRGFDFTAYKRASLLRRLLVRMQPLGLTSFAAYLHRLEAEPEEFTRLFNTILINVTGFFRDEAGWQVLREQVIPGMLGKPGATDPIRVWSAGCASGEEAYSVAMVLAEALGLEQFRDRVKIYATDVDEEALGQGRHAAYGHRTVENVPRPLLERYFDQVNDRFVVRKDIRRSVIFGRHDLIQDVPVSRINLLLCRNCLMYFHSEAQHRMLARFHFALVPGGVLWLGKAETLQAQSVAFQPVHVGCRLFRKTDGQPESRHLTGTSSHLTGTSSHLTGTSSHLTGRPSHLTGTSSPGYERHRRLRDAAGEPGPAARLLVDRDGIVVHLNQPLRTIFGLSARDIGRPLRDLELSYHPFELHRRIERAYAEREPSVALDGRWTRPGGHLMALDLSIRPLLDSDGTALGLSIEFQDVTRRGGLQVDVRRANLNTELQSTKAELGTCNGEGRGLDGRR
jgi:two-component system CheB/CheR fusion protein